MPGALNRFTIRLLEPEVTILRRGGDTTLAALRFFATPDCESDLRIGVGAFFVAVTFGMILLMLGDFFSALIQWNMNTHLDCNSISRYRHGQRPRRHL